MPSTCTWPPSSLNPKQERSFERIELYLAWPLGVPVPLETDLLPPRRVGTSWVWLEMKIISLPLFDGKAIEVAACYAVEHLERCERCLDKMIVLALLVRLNELRK